MVHVETVQEIVTIDAVKKHLRLAHTEEEAYLEHLIRVARQQLEHETGQILRKAQVRFTVERPPVGPDIYYKEGIRVLKETPGLIWFQVPKYPVLAVDSLEACSKQGERRRLDPSQYHINRQRRPVLMAVDSSCLESLEVQLQVGYDPEHQSHELASAQQALLQCIELIYENPEDIRLQAPGYEAVRMLARPLMERRFL